MTALDDLAEMGFVRVLHRVVTLSPLSSPFLLGWNLLKE